MTTRTPKELADALDAHAVIHENEYQDDNQREWAKDLRDAAAALRAGVSKPTRYPWDQAPDWARWAATDCTGDASWFADRPFQSKIGFYSRTAWTDINGHFDRSDWRNSLEKRPEKS